MMNPFRKSIFHKWWRRRRDQFRRQYQRVIPLPELMTDRWEKAQYLGFGRGASIYDSAFVFGEVKVGEGTWVGPYTVLDGSGGLEIGAYCSISAGVQIYSHDSVDWALSGGKKPYAYSPVKIGNRCYIGPNVIIARGVELGDGVVVGANSLVNRSFGPGARIAGNPARRIEENQSRENGD